MQNKPWAKELLFGIIFIVLAIITSTITNNWAVSFLMWMCIYIIWKWVEFYHFFIWYISGADTKKTPLSTGIWETLTNHVIKNNKNNQRNIKRNKLLLHQFDATAQALPYATILLNSKFEIKWSNKESQKLFGIVQKDLNSKIENIIRFPEFVKTLHDDKEINDIKIDNPTDSNKKIQIRMEKLSKKRHLIVARDISEQESLRKSRKAFVANASHELRTPLTVITGYLEILGNSDGIDEQWQMVINQAQSQAARMEKIIDDMLKLSSMEHERYLGRDDNTLDMPYLLNNLFNDVKNSKQAKGYVLNANIDSELGIRGDRDEMISLGLNLINNAIIHNPKGATITLKWFGDNNSAHMAVCDDGVGIEEQHLTHLTERFYRVDNSRDKNTNSTGLGLAIVKQICDNHDAQLLVESEAGKGSCFEIVFPRRITLSLTGETNL